MWPFVVVWRHFHVAEQNFEVINHLKLAGGGMNICEYAEKAN